MKTKFIILFNSNSERSYYKYKIEPLSNKKLNATNGFNEKVIGIKSIPYHQYLDEKDEIENRFKHKKDV